MDDGNVFSLLLRREGAVLPKTTDRIPLVPGQIFGIGRSMPGQEGLPLTVSRHHFDISVDESGHATVANMTPTNPTSIQAYWKNF